MARTRLPTLTDGGGGGSALRRLPMVIALGLVGYLVAKGVLWLTQWDALVALLTQADHAIYMNQAHRILAGGPLYPAWELAGPYRLEQLPELYPPTTVYGLIVPMSLLPDVLWWAIPLTVIAATVRYWRPSPWAWVAILACLAVPHTWTSIAAGNPALWAAAAVALGTRWGWPGALAVLKPTLAPFALVGVRTRGWWPVAAALVAVSLLMIPMWLDYVTVVRNNPDGGLLYSLGNIPMMLIPLAAWAGRRRLTGPTVTETLSPVVASPA